MRYETRKKKKNRWVLSIILVLALAINGNMLGEVHGVDDAAAAAAIGDVYFTTLDEAIATVDKGETIRLLKSVEIKPDIMVDEVITIKGESGVVDRDGVSFYLDLSGFEIFGVKDGALLQVDAGSVTVYNGTITNSNEEGLAVSANVLFPIGYEKDITENELIIPAAYHLQFTNSENGTIRYGSIEGLQVPLAEGDLYARLNTNHTFYFVPDVGYKVAMFTVNGINQAATNSYSISNLTQDEAINVSFDKITFTIAPLAYTNNAVSKRGLTLTPTPTTVEYGKGTTFNFTVRNGFKLIEVLVNGEKLQTLNTTGEVTTITLENITTHKMSKSY
jgi:hypothetical protein